MYEGRNEWKRSTSGLVVKRVGKCTKDQRSQDYEDGLGQQVSVIIFRTT